MQNYLVVGTRIVGYDYNVVEKLIKKYKVEAYYDKCYSLDSTDQLLRRLDVGYKGLKPITPQEYATLNGFTFFKDARDLGILYEDKYRISKAFDLLSCSTMALAELKGYDNFVVEDTKSGTKLISKGYRIARNSYVYDKQDVKKNSTVSYKSSIVASVLEIIKYIKKPISSVAFDYDISKLSSIYIKKSEKNNGEYDILIK